MNIKDNGLQVRPVKKLAEETTIVIAGRTFRFRQETSHKWTGYYEDDHGTLYEARTRKELLSEA